MKVWLNNEFQGHYPVGTAAVVAAESAEEAAELLNSALLSIGLSASATATQFEELNTLTQNVIILCDGSY